MKFICLALIAAAFICGCAESAGAAKTGDAAAEKTGAEKQPAAEAAPDTFQTLNELIRQNPNDAGLYFKRGSAYHGRDEYDKAIADYTEVIRLDTDYDNVYYIRGNAYLAKKDYAKAVADYEAALLRNPDNVGAQKNLGFARRQQGR